ncbi:MAG TPA: transposase [Candidatus Acidoferrales bacterium]|nr:transposase [Candidatus Acidoferrales bacterium]
MTKTHSIRLIPRDSKALLEFLSRFNRACNYVSEIAFHERLWHWLPLQRRTYKEIRGKFSLPSAAASAVVRKVAASYSSKGRRTRRALFRPYGAIPVYRHRYQRDGTTSFYGFGVPFLSRAELSSEMQAVLCYRRPSRKFILLQPVEVAAQLMQPAGDWLGCDLGIQNLLADSDGQTYSGLLIEEQRRIFSHRRRNLQRKQTRAAQRKLRKISGQQSRYQRDVNHCLSKAVVRKAQQLSCGIALEDLKGIRERIKARRRQRARLHNWLFGQLRRFILYKAALAGIPVLLVSPAHTSQQCSRCGNVDARNRRNRNDFVCLHCGLTAAADTNAARNIRARALGDAPNGVSPKVAAAMPATNSLGVSSSE